MFAVIGLFYAVTSVGALLLGLVQPLLGVDPVIIELTQFGPTLGVLAVLLAWRGRWRPPLATGLVPRRHVLVRLVAVVGITAGIFGAVVGVYALLGTDVHYTSAGKLSEPFWLIAAAQLVGACGEELGWRCFLQPYLRTRYPVVASGAIVGVLWGGWHVGVFAAGPAYAAAFLTAATAVSIIMAVLLEGARDHNLLVAGVLHALINLGLLLLMTEEDGDLTAQIVFAAACVPAALGVTLVGAVYGSIEHESTDTDREPARRGRSGPARGGIR
jgi:membrane protease YdiL (CAAX protease family)